MSELENLLDRLSDLVESSKKIPLSNSIRVDKNEIEDIIVEMNASIPNSIKEAEEVITDCDQYVRSAQKEAEQIIEQANMEQTKLISDHEVYVRAVDKAEELTAKTNEDLNNAIIESMLEIDRVLENAGNEITRISEVLQSANEQMNVALKTSAKTILTMREQLRD